MITLNVSPDGREMTVEGHAGGVYGRDIVCAGVSALVCTLAIFLEDDPGASVTLRSGFARFRVSSRRSREAVRFAAMGIEQCIKDQGKDKQYD